MRFHTALFLFIAVTVSARAGVVDTIRYFDPGAGLVYFDDPSIRLQAARFIPRAPGIIHAIQVTLGGASSDGTIRLRIFGLDGGGPAPLLQADLIAPLTLRKSRVGPERVTVELPEPLAVDGSQFFVAFDRPDPGVRLLADRTRRKPSCVSGSESFYYQFLQLSDGHWRWGSAAFAVGVVMEYPKLTPAGYLADVTEELGLDDSLIGNGSIAWADVNDDGFLDLLVDGRLYRNDGGRSFTDITRTSGIGEAPLGNVFIDADVDGHLDLLFIGPPESGGSLLFLNDGSGGFRSRALESVGPIARPTSISIADADGDQRPDLFIGQREGPGRLLINDNGAFTDRSDLLIGGSSDGRGSSWVDADNDGVPELFVAGANRAELWKRGADGRYRNRLAGEAAGGGGGGVTGIGGDWADFDNDGVEDLLLPARPEPAAARRHVAETGAEPSAGLYAGRATRHASFPEKTSAPADAMLADATLADAGLPIGLELARSGGTWGDVNNDGLLDFIVTTDCACHYADLYLQQSGGGFQRQTFEYGLAGTAAGADAVWVDVDNDGRLDLATIVNGHLRLYRNGIAAAAGSYVAVDLAGAGAEGAVVTIDAGGRRYSQRGSSGRGLLMQDPLRLHFGLGDARRIDTLRIAWADGHSERYTDLSTAALYRVGRGRINAARGGGLRVEASPNPFTTELRLTCEVDRPQTIRLAIYSLDGQHVADLLDGRVDAGEHDVVWRAVDRQGRRLPTGTYVYRLRSEDGEAVGTVLLIN